MHVIKLTPCEPGVYSDHASDNITMPPEGWAVIPDDFTLPSTFPRLGSIKAKELTYTRDAEVIGADGEPVAEKQEYTMMTVISMTEGTVPEPVEPEPTQLDIIEAQVTYTAMITDTLLGG